ncbi:MAG: transcriptional repressor NrdR [Lentisphaeria bacterium]|nr:transcriptional regulator NrdR [Lentisphaeria bacterium]NQZ71128.1 transcriptional repressor NrdR [Lentisphaeria bacterium]
MRCPKCDCKEIKVLDSRVSKNGRSIRRRRECLECSYRFSTIEEIVPSELYVIKRDKSRDDFNPQKLRDGIEKACYKRPVNQEQIDELVQVILNNLETEGMNEIPSEKLGAMVMAELENLDEVAYVRFASVYKKFKDIDQFINEIRNLSDRQK